MRRQHSTHTWRRLPVLVIGEHGSLKRIQILAGRGWWGKERWVNENTLTPIEGKGASEHESVERRNHNP